MPDVCAISLIPGELASGPPGVCSVDSAQEMSSAIRGLGLWKKLVGEYLRSTFPCAFMVISLGFRRATMPCRDESRNSLRTSGTYLTQLEYYETRNVTRETFYKNFSYIYTYI